METMPGTPVAKAFVFMPLASL